MDIRDVSLRYLTYRSRSRKEMRDHLLKKGYSEEDTEEELTELAEAGLINDIEFAKVFMDASFSKGRGLVRIKRELAQKGLSAFDIEDAMAEFEDENDCDLDEGERQRAALQAEKFMRGLEIDDKVLMKLSRKLITLGYSPSLMYDIVAGYRKERQE